MAKNDWWRCWHGAPTDAKFTFVAELVGDDISPAEIAWLFSHLIDHASQADDRGSIAGFNTRLAVSYLRKKPDRVDAMIAALREYGLITGDRLTAWEKRQPARERDVEDDSKERTRKWRAKPRRAPAAAATEVTAVTPSDASDDHVTAVTPSDAIESESEKTDSTTTTVVAFLNRARPSMADDELADRIEAGTGGKIERAVIVRGLDLVREWTAGGLDLDLDVIPCLAERVACLTQPLETLSARWLPEKLALFREKRLAPPPAVPAVSRLSGGGARASPKPANLMMSALLRKYEDATGPRA
jgi:hypothetical protein